MIQAAIGIVLALVASLALQSWRLGAAHDEIKAMRAAQVAAQLVEAESARMKATALTRATERNDRETQTRLAAARAAAAAARGDLQRVLDGASVLAASAPNDPGAAGCVDDGRLGRLASLLGEGASLVAEGSERVDRLAAEKAGLQRDAAELRRVLVAPGATP